MFMTCSQIVQPREFLTEMPFFLICQYYKLCQSDTHDTHFLTISIAPLKYVMRIITTPLYFLQSEAWVKYSAFYCRSTIIYIKNTNYMNNFTQLGTMTCALMTRNLLLYNKTSGKVRLTFVGWFSSPNFEPRRKTSKESLRLDW